MIIMPYDRDAVQTASNLHLVAGPVNKLGVVLEADQPSDMDSILTFASSIVALDDGRWRMYYSCVGEAFRRMGVGVAESDDGLTWTKPKLGQMEWEGEDTNRILIEGLPEDARIIQPQVVRLRSGRWMMYCWLHGQHEGRVRYIISESDDGLLWRARDLDRPAIYHPADLEVGQNRWAAGLTDAPADDRFSGKRTRDWLTAKRLRSNDATYVYYDAGSGRFEMFSVWLAPNDEHSGRRVPHDNAPAVLRVIHRRESEDGLDWSAPELLITPDERDPLDQQFYYLAAHEEDEWRIGFLGHYRCWEQTMDIELCFSRDGRRWERPLRGAYVPRDPIPERGCMSAYAPNALIDQGDHWLMLYTAGNTKHNHEPPLGVAEPWRGIMGACIPKGRFAALASEPGMTGRLTLKPFIPTAREIRIDANVRGRLRAELRDPFGRPLEGFELHACRPVQGDAADHLLVWGDGRTSRGYQYDAVSLQIELEDGELFRIRA